MIPTFIQLTAYCPKLPASPLEDDKVNFRNQVIWINLNHVTSIGTDNLEGIGPHTSLYVPGAIYKVKETPQYIFDIIEEMDVANSTKKQT